LAFSTTLLSVAARAPALERIHSNEHNDKQRKVFVFDFIAFLFFSSRLFAGCSKRSRGEAHGP
jgi:hypothetical protein